MQTRTGGPAHGSAASPQPAAAARAGGAPARGAAVAAVGAVAATVAAGVVARFVTTSDLWLDEALSVSIARLPVGDVFDALRHDGHPPLYYLLLHGWMALAGEGDVAVRALSGLLSAVTLPLAWVAGRRYAGRPGAIAALLLLATSPFAVRYATEARMYALVMLLVTAGWLAVQRAWDRPTAARLVAVSLASGLLLLTHYWALYLVAATAGLLAWRAWRGPSPAPARRLLVAVVAGGVLFLPWLPGFLDQLQHTGTPWGRPARPAPLLMVSLADFGGGAYGEAQVLGVGLAALAVLALLARAVDRRRLELDLATRPEARPEAALVAGTVAVALAASWLTGSAFASRYMAAVFPLVVLLAALGVTRFASAPVRVAVLAGVVLLGAVGMGHNVVTQRTQGGEVVTALAALAQPGDVVGFCPDQLGPAVDRSLRDDVVALTYPAGGSPARVDWVDYADRVAAGDPGAYAATLLDRADPGATVWLVWASGYRTHDRACESVVHALAGARPRTSVVVEARSDVFEPMWLQRYPPS